MFVIQQGKEKSMGRKSTRENKTIYQQLREEDNLPREKASELLAFISEDLFVYAGFAVDCEGDGGFGNAKMSGDIDHFYFHRDTCLSGENVVGENCLRVELYGLLMFIFKHFKLLI